MNKTVFITGASSGIGKATAIHFANQGWNVAATMRAPITTTELTKYPLVKQYALDVTDPDSIHESISQAISDFGCIDVLVNNAGYSADGVFEAMDDNVIKSQFDTNVFGLMRVTREIIPHMRNQGSGIIIQVSSMGGCITFPFYSIYHSSKWAVEGFSESLHWELEPFNIRVKMIEPGAIKTDFYSRSRRRIMPSDLDIYKSFMESAEKVSMSAGQTGEQPEKVAKAIFLAATDGKKKLRYPVGKPAPMVLFLRKLLPDALFFKIVKQVYKI